MEALWGRFLFLGEGGRARRVRHIEQIPPNSIFCTDALFAVHHSAKPSRFGVFWGAGPGAMGGGLSSTPEVEVMASSRRLPSGADRQLSMCGGGSGSSDEALSRIDDLMAMGRQCLCVRNREEGHALLLAHAMDAAEADVGLLFEVASTGKGHLIAAQGLAASKAHCERLRREALPLDLELAALFRKELGLPSRTRCFESPLLGRDGPCGVLVLFWLEALPAEGDCPMREAGGLEAALASPHLAGEVQPADPYLERVAEQCAQSLEHLRIFWNLEQALERIEAIKRHEREQLAFFCAVAHELRSPVNALRGGLQLLEELDSKSAWPEEGGADTRPAQTLSAAPRRGERHSPSSEAALRRADKVIQAALQRLARLAEDLAVLGRLGMGRFSLRKERCELTDLIASALAKIEGELEGTRVELRADIGTRPLIVEADRERVAQILDNLLSNAQRHTQEGFIEVRAGISGGDALISIGDSGIGLPADRLAALFEPFWSARARFDARQGGMGIGLSIARQLAERQGGRLEVKSEGLGKGCRAELRFPLKGGAPVP